jgi:hypothetical protein
MLLDVLVAHLVSWFDADAHIARSLLRRDKQVGGCQGVYNMSFVSNKVSSWILLRSW